MPKNPPITQPSKKPKIIEGLASRGAALDILRLLRSGLALDEALSVSKTFESLEGADRGFARALVMTVLRRRNTLDEIYAPFLDRPLKPNQHEVRTILRLAAAQIIFLETPPHAAASTAVDLARERRETAGFAKLINALCRRMAEADPERIKALPPRTDTPGWFWRKLERSHGAKAARTIAQVHASEPPLDLTFRTSADRDEWAEKLGAEPVGEVSLRQLDRGRTENIEGYEDGIWWVQDLAATLPARLAGDVAGKRVYDLCAAPGGKTMQLAAAGADVTAVDISPSRMERLTANLQRTNLKATSFICDVLDWQPEDLADVVLLDAPCTATGTVRRHPDLLWSKKEEDAEALAVLQDRMLDHVTAMVAPGGLLIFATCSLLPEEGEERAARFLKTHPEFERVPVTEEDVAGLPVINRDGDLRCTPAVLADKGGMDGFFAARFRKKD
ncbi:RsmB/NOP family class I SAM-dependent RNA methyltransferase [Parvularcula marina]|uniref:Methyltransferase domain-containing protein n=1 Tax=Parvularcula marina TaxID=2292771 RepID=A0A371RIA2_9PROT|nr:transcription antitermination factor NusB [Parvularcula marina]RFB05172.1 methyltransferase domain-containing protein [Parvularcula marina]